MARSKKAMTQRLMPMAAEELERITGRTLAHYDQHAQLPQ